MVTNKIELSECDSKKKRVIVSNGSKSDSRPITPIFRTIYDPQGSWFELSKDNVPQCASALTQRDMHYDMIILMVHIHLAISTGICDHQYRFPNYILNELICEYELVTWTNGLFDGGTHEFYDRLIFLQDILKNKLYICAEDVDQFMGHAFDLLDGLDETFSERFRTIQDMENIIFKVGHRYSCPVEGTIFPLSREQLRRLGYNHNRIVSSPQSSNTGLFKDFKEFLDKKDAEQPSSSEEAPITNFEFAKGLFSEYRKGHISEDLDKIDKILNSVSDILPKIPISQANELVLKVTELISKFEVKDDKGPRNRNLLLGYALLVTFSLLYFKYKDNIYLVLASAIAGYLLFATDFKEVFSKILAGTGLWELLLTTMQKYFMTETEPQMEPGTFTHMCKLFGSIYTLFVIKGTPAEKRYDEIYRKVVSWDRFSNNIADIFKMIIDSTAGIIDAVFQLCSDSHPNAKYSRWLSTNNLEIDDFITKVDALCGEFYSMKLKSSQANLLRATKLRVEGRNLVKQLGRTPIPIPMQQVLRELDVILKKLHSSETAALGNRVEPLFLLFVGPAGIGKSKICRSIAHYLVAKSLETPEEKLDFVEDCNYYMYYRKSGEPYWEGYDPTMKAVIYDDINQYVDVEGGTYSELLELIYLINSEPYPLNMAFDFKGKMFASPDLVFASTNSPCPNIKSINHQDAYYRRCKHSFYAVPKPEYTLESTLQLGIESRKLDFDKVPKDEKGVPIIGKKVLEFIRIRYPSAGKYETFGIPMSYDEVCSYALENLEFNRKIHLQECQLLKEERIRALYEDVENIVPQSHIAFDTDDTIMQTLYESPYVSYDDEDEFDQKVGHNWDDADHEYLLEFLRKVDSSSSEFVKIMYILNKFYISHNTEHFSTVPTNEEVIVSYLIRYGSRFVTLLQQSSAEEIKQFCCNIVLKEQRFTRKYMYLLFPHRKYSYWMLIKAKVHATKETIWCKYIKGTWVEFLHECFKYYVQSNPMVVSLVLGLVTFQAIIAFVTNRFITPVYKELRDIGHEIELTAKTLHEIHKRDPKEIELIYEMLKTDRNFLAVMTSDTTTDEEKQMYLFQALQMKEMEHRCLNKEPIVVEEYLEKTFKGEDGRKLTKKELEDKWAIQNLKIIDDNIDEHFKTEEIVDLIMKDKEKAQLNKGLDFEPEYGKQLKRQAKLKSNVTSKVKLKSKVEPQMGLGLDNNGDNIMMKVMNCNSYDVYYQQDHVSTELTKLGSLCFVKGYIAIHPKHYLVRLMNIWKGCLEHGYDYGETWFVLRQSNEKYKREYKAKMKDLFTFDPTTGTLEGSYIPLPGCSDLVLSKIRMPNMGSSSNIIKYFCTKTEFENCAMDTPGSLLVPSEGILKIVPITARKQSHPVEYKCYDEDFDCFYTFSYNAPTSCGDCGGLLALSKPRLNSSRIFGMHVAGGTTVKIGHSETVFRESILVVIDYFDETDTVDMKFDDSVIPTHAQCADGQFQVIGEITPSQPLVFSSSITKSLLFNRLEVQCSEIPAKLGKTMFQGALTDPWDHNLKKYCKNTSVYVDPFIVKAICSQIYIDLVNSSHTSVDKEVLTIEDAILGEDKFDLGSIPRDTSPGYPHICNPVTGLPKRQRFFGKDILGYSLEGIHYDMLKIRVEEIVDSANKNERLFHYSCDNLKDECVDVEKVIGKLKTRIFNNFPVEKLIVDKMYFGAFSSWLIKNKVSNCIGIGVNPYSSDWDMIGRKLLCFGAANLQNIGAGDYSCFDGSETLQIMNAINEHIICKWYGDIEGNKVREILFMDISNSVHIRGKLVYRWEGGNTSGNFLTAPLNCLYNMFNFYYSWLRLHDFDLSSLRTFKENVSCMFLGDDNAYSVHPNYRELFTEYYLSEALKDLGCTYTSELKDTVNFKMRTIYDIEFLKRKFIFDPCLGRWMGALRLESSIQGLYWTQKDPEKFIMVTRDKVDTVLCELSIHGKFVFDQFAAVINKATMKYMDYLSDFSVYELAYAEVLKREYVY